MTGAGPSWWDTSFDCAMLPFITLDSTSGGLAASTNGSYSAGMSPATDPTPEAPQPPPISLKELSEAFAQAMGGAEATPAPDVERSDEPAAGKLPTEPEKGPHAAPPPEDGLPRQVTPLSIFEAMLFVGNRENEPLAAAQAAELMRGVEPGEIPELVAQLNQRYATAGCPYKIIREGPGYRITLRDRFGPLRNRFYGRVREAHLSRAAVDVLAIVAYRQPLTSDEVSRLRDRPSGPLLTQLVRRRLLRVERPKDKPRRLLYYTTDRFLQMFGLAGLEDLPQAE